MKIKYGIIGLPNIGKSTLFNLITKSNVKNENYPFCTINANYKNISIQDRKIKKIIKKKTYIKITYPYVKFVDIAGLIKGANKGLGLGNKFLKNIQHTNILIHVVRLFINHSITHVYNSIEPIRDIKIITTELKLNDLNYLKKIKKKKIYDDKKIDKLIFYLKNNKFYELKKNQFSFPEKKNLLILKPQVFLLNINLNKKTYYHQIEKIKKIYNNIIVINMEHKNISNILYINTIIKKIINLSFKILKIKTFYTIENKKITGFILKKHDNILKAAQKVHTDFCDNFIKAEVINYSIFIKYNSWKTAKKKGHIKYRGKKYIVKDGDIIKFNLKKKLHKI